MVLINGKNTSADGKTVSQYLEEANLLNLTRIFCPSRNTEKPCSKTAMSSRSSALWEEVNMPTKEEWQNAFAARHGEKLQKVFSSSVVAVCGLGGLGSNIATALARAGIGKLILIDFDSVDLSNLHRQQYKASQIGKYKTDAIVENLCEINPYIRTEAHTIRLTEENALTLLSQADVICEAFDNPQAKAMLCNLVLEKLPQKNASANAFISAATALTA